MRQCSAPRLASRLSRLCVCVWQLISETRRESADMFGESADNITAVCVAFDTIVPADDMAI